MAVKRLLLLLTYVLYVCVCLQNGPLPFSLLTFVAAWLIRELLFIFIYFEAVSNVRHITWGKRTYRMSDFGRSLSITNDRSALLLV